MFILQIKNKLILILALFMMSCHALVPIEPVASVNDRFMADYGNSIKKAKKRHYNNIKESGYDGSVSFEKTAYGRKLQNEADFLEANAKNNPYPTVERADSKNLKYVSGNFGSYVNNQENVFDSIEIPKNDFQYYYIGQKDYNDVDNIELQEAYDYIESINIEKARQVEYARMKQEADQPETNDGESFADKAKRGFQSLTDKIKSLLK